MESESGLGTVSRAWRRLRPANRIWLWITVGTVVACMSSYLAARSRTARVADTPLGLVYGALAFACMLTVTAYSVRKRWRPLVAQRALGGKKRIRRTKQRREARIREARHAMAVLQAEISQGSALPPVEIRRRARRTLRSVRATRLLHVQVEAEAGRPSRLWLVEKQPPGSLENWLLAHSYLGILTALLVLLHSGFRLGGAVATLGVLLTGLVGLSGVAGAFLYVAIPRAMEVGKEPLLLPEMRAKITEVETAMAGFLRDKSGPFQVLFLSGQELSEEDIIRVEEEEQVHFQRMLELQARKRALEARLARHQRLQSYLRGWLYVHVPAATFLLTTVLIHILSILYY